MTPAGCEVGNPASRGPSVPEYQMEVSKSASIQVHESP